MQIGLGLRGKLVMMTLCMTLATALVFAAMSYAQVRSTVRKAAGDRLSDTARHHSGQISDVLEQTAIDVTVFAGLPPVTEIVQGVKANASPGAHRKRRLQNIFKSILKTRPHYTQLRFIGQANNWQELVRVNGGLRGLRVIPAADLQAKAGEPYLNRPGQVGGGSRLFFDRDL